MLQGQNPYVLELLAVAEIAEAVEDLPVAVHPWPCP
jgi:hypothetical protein